LRGRVRDHALDDGRFIQYPDLDEAAF